jgi:hypothetical protein
MTGRRRYARCLLMREARTMPRIAPAHTNTQRMPPLRDVLTALVFQTHSGDDTTARAADIATCFVAEAQIARSGFVPSMFNGEDLVCRFVVDDLFDRIHTRVPRTRFALHQTR